MTPSERVEVVLNLLHCQETHHPVRLVLLSGNVVGGINTNVVGFNATSPLAYLTTSEQVGTEGLVTIVSIIAVPISHIDYIEDLGK